MTRFVPQDTLPSIVFGKKCLKPANFAPQLRGGRLEQIVPRDSGGKKWCNEGIQSYNDAVRRSRLQTQRNGLDEEELRTAYNGYKKRKDDFDRVKYCARWRVLNRFQQLVDEECKGRSTRLYGGDRALYEMLFRAEPRKYIHRHRFLTVMRDVYGFDIAPSDHVGNLEALRVLNLVFETFDLDGCDQVDWRLLLFMLGVTVQAENTFSKNMRFGFAIFSGEGSFDPDCQDPIQLSDLRDLMITLIKHSARGDMAARFEESWQEVVAIDAEAAKLQSQSEARGDRPGNVRVSLRLMNLMLEQVPLSILFQTARKFGIRDSQPWTYIVEEKYYDDYVLNLLMDRRRLIRGNVLALQFLAQAQERQKRFYADRWKAFCNRRSHACELTRRIINRQFQNAAVIPFYRLRRAAITHLCCVRIQAVFRGREGRKLAAYVQELRRSAMLIQACFRGLRARQRYLKWQHRSHWAALDMQRTIRAFQGRNRAQRRLKWVFDQGITEIDANVTAWETQRFETAAQIIQRAWRRHKACNDAKVEVETVKTRRQLDAEMQEVAQRREKEEAIYKRELAEWYIRERVEFERNRVTENTTKEEKRKIMLYRRKATDQLRAAREAKLRAAEDNLEDVRIQQWQAEWEKRGEERAAAKRQQLAQLFMQQDTVPERQLLKKIQAEIKAQAKVVINLADEQGVTDLEWSDAHEIARGQIIELHIDREREVVVQEMKAAAAAYMAEQERKREEKRSQKAAVFQEASEAAARKLQRMYRQWKALTEVRERAMEVYAKRFHAESGHYYWINTVLHTCLWERPSALGSYDVDPPDEWLTMEGSFELTYYYNPRTLSMSWSVPQDTLICSVCQVYFAERLCDRDHQLYCTGCYDRKHFGQDPTPDWRTLTYKVIRGGLCGVEDLLENPEELESFRAFPPTEPPRPLPLRIATAITNQRYSSQEPSFTPLLDLGMEIMAEEAPALLQVYDDSLAAEWGASSYSYDEQQVAGEDTVIAENE